MLVGLLYLILFQLLGHLIVVGLAIPIPSPVVGLVLLFVYLLIKGHVPASLLGAANILLPLLPLFLIPASAGIIQYGDLIMEDGVAIVAALLGSLTISILVVPHIFLFFIRLFRSQP